VDSQPRITLYVIAASHPSRAARRMLEHKAIEHRVVSLLSGFHPLLLRLHGFRGRTVPALRVGRERVQGSLAISRALEDLRPAPPLFPADPARRREVEEAERWGEAVLQPVPRRLYRWALVRDARVRRDLAGQNRMPLRGLAARLMKPLAAVFARDSGADDAAIRADLALLPAHLDRVDAWIAAGVLGAAEPSAADFQIAASIRMLLNFDDLRDRIGDRPAAGLARRLFPEYPGEVPPVFARDWLAPWVRAGAGR
jgi:glutathione S-transferase